MPKEPEPQKSLEETIEDWKDPEYVARLGGYDSEEPAFKRTHKAFVEILPGVRITNSLKSLFDNKLAKNRMSTGSG